MNFIDDFRNLLVNDSSISGFFGTRIYYQLLPKNIERDQWWLRWAINEKTEPIYYIGSSKPVSTKYNISIDILNADQNELSRVSEWIKDKILTHQNSGGIKSVAFLDGDSVPYEEKDIYVEILNFKVQHS